MLYRPMKWNTFQRKANGNITAGFGIWRMVLSVDSKQGWYEMVAKPVEKLNRLIGYMIVGFVTAGILLFGILTSLSVKGRKREIGIYFDGGTQKKDLGQFVWRIWFRFDCPGFAALCATPTAEYSQIG